VCLGIAPWNAPIILGTRAVAPAIACGNTAILKASEMCPATHLGIGEAFRRAGAPDGVMNVVTNAPEDAAEVVGALIAAPEVRHINFTGSTGVGKIIAQTAATHLKPVLLELGGKAPLVILDDADVRHWFEPDPFIDGAMETEIVSGAERISKLVDMKGGGAEFTASGDRRPYVQHNQVNGLAFARFMGDTLLPSDAALRTQMTLSGKNFDFASPYTIIFFGNVSALSDNDTIIGQIQNATNKALLNNGPDGTTFRHQWGANAVEMPLVQGENGFVITEFNGTHLTGFCDGVTTASVEVDLGAGSSGGNLSVALGALLSNSQHADMGMGLVSLVQASLITDAAKAETFENVKRYGQAALGAKIYP
jgi:hypothetical protein